MIKLPKQIRICVDAIIVVDNHILVCDIPDGSFTYLPGGGIEVGESIPDALRREMQEELRKDIKIGKYVGYFDQLFELDNKIIHEICHIFRVDLVGVESLEKLDAFEEVPSVQWVHIDKLAEVNLKPDLLKSKIPELLKNDTGEIWHISRNEISNNRIV